MKTIKKNTQTGFTRPRVANYAHAWKSASTTNQHQLRNVLSQQQESSDEAIHPIAGYASEEILYKVGLADAKSRLMRKEGMGKTNINPYTDGTQQIRQILRGGDPLSQSSRLFFEPRFGMDLSHVRIHDDYSAHQASYSVNARAFTIGNHIAFNNQEYQPETHNGKQLLAHELTHVVQQQQSNTLHLQRKPLPKKYYENIDYKIKRILSEVNYYLKNNKPAKAKKAATSLKKHVTTENLIRTYGFKVADAYFRVGLHQDAFQILEKIRSENLHKERPSMKAAKMLYDQASKALNAKKNDLAFTVFSQLFRWLEKSELTSQTSMFHASGPLKSFVHSLYPKLITGLFAIPTYYRTQGDRKKANQYLKKIKSLLTKSIIKERYGYHAAQAFINMGQHGNAFWMLAETQKYIQGTLLDKHVNPQKTINFLIKNGQQELKKKQWENASKLFLHAMQWLKTHQPALSDNIVNLNKKRTITANAVYEVMGGLLAIIDFHSDRAAAAYKAGKPEAAKLANTAQSWIDRLKAGLKDVSVYPAIVAKITHKKETHKKAVYHDAAKPAIKMKVGPYEGPSGSSGGKPTYTFEDRKRRITSILAAKKLQLTSVKEFYGKDKVIVEAFKKKMRRTPDIHKLDDRRIFWKLKYQHLIAAKKSRRQALQALIYSIGDYLTAFTIHTKYNVPDTKRDVLTSTYPKSLHKQALKDCGVYAMHTAYELSLLRNMAGIDFYFVGIPQHVYLAVVDRSLKFGWGLSNHKFRTITGNISKQGVAGSVASLFGVLPTPFGAKKLSSFTQRGLYNTFHSLPGNYFLPANYHRLKGRAKRKAEKKAAQLIKRYINIRNRSEKNSRRITFILLDLKSRYNKLNKKKPNIKQQQDFNKYAISVIEPNYSAYENYIRDMFSYYNDMKKIRRNPKTYTRNAGAYLTNMYLLLRYMAYQLGKDEYKSRTYIKKPPYEEKGKPYKGDPLPWIKAKLDFSED